VSGAVARQWDYSRDDEDELEAEAEAQAALQPEPEMMVDELDLTQPYHRPTLYTRPFSRKSYEEELPAEAQYHYSYQNNNSLRPRRATRFAPLDSVLGLLSLLPMRGLIGLGIGLMVAWFVISNGLSMLSQATSSTREVYSFNDSAAVKVNKASAAGNLILGGPTITPAKINTILQQYNSPAAGIGQTLYDLGLRYGIDPAYALAFFIHESSAGTQGVAVNTKSIGNIRCTSGYDCYQASGNGSFRRYASWEAGAEDWYKLIKELYVGKWNLTTLEQIIPVYAPSADQNNPAAYIQQVVKLVNDWRSSK